MTPEMCSGEEPDSEEPRSTSSVRNYSAPGSFPRSASKVSFPVYLRTSPAEHVTIAYFPMGTSEIHPHSRISTISKNDIDGRVRCEVKDSVIHGREQTAEGIPIDYQMTWESSPAPTDTFRKDYYMYKKNGKLFLSPAQVVHMRTVIEPKGSRQETKGFLSQSAHQGHHQQTNNALPTGKWVKFKMDDAPADDVFRVDEKDLQRCSPQRDNPAVDLEGVIKSALSMQNGSVADLATNSTALLSSAKSAAAASELAAVFKTGRIQRFSNITKLLPGKTTESLLDALKSCAFLVQGNWVGQGRMFFEDRPGAVGFPLRLCFDFLLSYFARNISVDVSIPNARLKLKTTTLNGVLNMFARHVGGTTWKLQIETDLEFVRSNPDLAKTQERAWEVYRSTLEKSFEALAKSTTPVVKDQLPVPVFKTPAPVSKPENEDASDGASSSSSGKRKSIPDADTPSTNKKPVRGGRGRGRGSR